MEELRREASPYVSMVAEEDGEIVGHILFTPVILTGHSELKIMGLGPMAVKPDWQVKGIGSSLVRAGLENCMDMGYGAVVVLGHTWFYPKFGFVPAVRYGVKCEYDAPVEAFMALELIAGYLNDAHGTIQYLPAFNGV